MMTRVRLLFFMFIIWCMLLSANKILYLVIAILLNLDRERLNEEKNK